VNEGETEYKRMVELRNSRWWWWWYLLREAVPAS